MRTIVTLAVKDLRLLTRDYFGLFWLLVFPLLYALFFGTIFGGNGSGSRALAIAIADEDDSDGSRALIERLRQSEALAVELLPQEQGRDAVRKGRLVAYVVVPAGFGKTPVFGGGKSPALQIGIDPSRRAEEGYLQGILLEAASARMQDMMSDPKRSREEIEKSLKALEGSGLPPEQRDSLKHFLGEVEQLLGKEGGAAKRGNSPFQLTPIEKVPVTAEATGPRSAFEITFPSAVVWAIMGCVTSFAISLVTERTAGTLLRLRVAPLTQTQFLAGKGLACFSAATTVAALLLFLGRLVFGVRVESLLGLTLAIVCAALCFTGIMMFVSTLGKTERAVAGAGWGTLMPLAMLGGGMVPLIAMPSWMRLASSVSPVKWAILALEGAIWRDYRLEDMLLPCGILLAVGAVTFAMGARILRHQEL